MVGRISPFATPSDALTLTLPIARFTHPITPRTYPHLLHYFGAFLWPIDWPNSVHFREKQTPALFFFSLHCSTARVRVPLCDFCCCWYYFYYFIIILVLFPTSFISFRTCILISTGALSHVPIANRLKCETYLVSFGCLDV